MTTPAPPPVPPPQVIDIDLDVNKLAIDLRDAVAQVKEIQVLVASFIDSIVVRKNDEAEKERQVIKSTIKQVMTIRSNLDNLGSKYAKLRLQNINAVPLGNTGYICLDPTEEQSGFYKDLLECYTWLNNLDRDATYALNMMKRKHITDEHDGNKRLRRDEQTLNDIVYIVKNDFPDLTINMNRLAQEQCLEVKINQVFTIYFFFTGLLVSHCTVKSMEESFMLEPAEPSHYTVFKKLTNVFIARILCLLDEKPEEILRKLLQYAQIYKDVFNIKCTVCNKHLGVDCGPCQLLPPIWVDIETKQFRHLSCLT